jgi:hypothetical protein
MRSTHGTTGMRRASAASVDSPDRSDGAKPNAGEPNAADRWQRVQALFHAAVAVPRGERAQWIAEAAGDDSALQSLLTALVSADDAPAPILDASPDTLGAALAPAPWPIAMLVDESLAAVPGERPPPGGRIGGFVLARELGRGAMGTVYLAHAEADDGTVAVKVLRRSLTAAVATDRFRREISLASALAHPHLLPILDSGEGDGLLWYAMPHVAGGSLRARIKRGGALPLRDAVRIARDVASALATVHDAGIVHRDVKPANVLLDDDVALLADFGVARVLSAGGTQLRSELTATGAQIGTPLYMSPEQGRGDDLVDARSDLYGLGATLFEMVTGTRAYAGTPAAAWPDLRTLVPVPSARRLRPDVPASLERLLEWMLAVDRDARPPNAIAVVAALDGAAADRGIVAP